jgi:hypothetical protein
MWRRTSERLPGLKTLSQADTLSSVVIRDTQHAHIRHIRHTDHSHTIRIAVSLSLSQKLKKKIFFFENDDEQIDSYDTNGTETFHNRERNRTMYAYMYDDAKQYV